LKRGERHKVNDKESTCLKCKDYYHLSGVCSTIPPIDRCTNKNSPKYGDLIDGEICQCYSPQSSEQKQVERKIKSDDVVFWKPSGRLSMGRDGNPRRYVIWNIRHKYATIETEELYRRGLTFQKIDVPISELEIAK
jgi:hypothetical protein